MPSKLACCSEVTVTRVAVFLMQTNVSLKTRLGRILAKAVAMRVMINATGCPAPVLDRNRMKTQKHLSEIIASAIDHDIPTPV